LEPRYGCEVGSRLFDTIKSVKNPPWSQHLAAASQLFATLDAISGVPPADEGFHASFDHYYDNLSARQCHAKPLPCRLGEHGANTGACVTPALADAVYRLGQWEYSQIYRDGGASTLAASATTFGVWIAELAMHLREVVEGARQGEGVLWSHNVAHDGSVSRLLSVLQVDVMVWPGMGAEVVFELWRKKGPSSAVSPAEDYTDDEVVKRPAGSTSGYRVRVLFGGKVLRSSSPTLGTIDMIPVETLLAYFDGLVGARASLVKGKCHGTIPV
jgi:2-phosphoxylose phosphatase